MGGHHVTVSRPDYDMAPGAVRPTPAAGRGDAGCVYPWH